MGNKLCETLNGSKVSADRQTGGEKDVSHIVSVVMIKI